MMRDLRPTKFHPSWNEPGVYDVKICNKCGLCGTTADLPAFKPCIDCGSTNWTFDSGKWISEKIWWKPWTWNKGYWSVGKR